MLIKVFQYSGDFKIGKVKEPTRNEFTRSLGSGPQVEERTEKGIYFPIARVIAVGQSADIDWTLSEAKFFNDGTIKAYEKAIRRLANL